MLWVPPSPSTCICDGVAPLEGTAFLPFLCCSGAPCIFAQGLGGSLPLSGGHRPAVILRLRVAAHAEGLGVLLVRKQTCEMRLRSTGTLVQRGLEVTAPSSIALTPPYWSGDKDTSPLAGNFVSKVAAAGPWRLQGHRAGARAPLPKCLQEPAVG